MAELFKPLTINDVTLPNRIVVSPMGQYSGDGDGNATNWHIMHLGSFAVSGAGLVILEASAVEPRGRVSPVDLGLWSDENAAALEPVLAFCRKQGETRWGIQLAHSGRKGSVSPAWEGQQPLSLEQGGWELASPSAVPYPGRATPKALNHADLEEIRAAFRAAAIRARDLGVEVIEIHGAHGYLLHSFLSPFANFREDEFGGDLENRMRFPLQVFKDVREVWPENRVLGVRLSVTDWAEGGWDVEDSIVLARRLKELGCDYITASSGGATPQQQIPIGPGYQIPLGAAIRQNAGITTMGVGLITEPTQAEKIIASGRVDLVALGRGMLFNPRWVWHAAFELGERIYIPPQYQRSHPAMRSGDFLKPRMDEDAAADHACAAPPGTTHPDSVHERNA